MHEKRNRNVPGTRRALVEAHIPTATKQAQHGYVGWTVDPSRNRDGFRTNFGSSMSAGVVMLMHNEAPAWGLFQLPGYSKFNHFILDAYVTSSVNFIRINSRSVKLPFRRHGLWLTEIGHFRLMVPGHYTCPMFISISICKLKTHLFQQFYVAIAAPRWSTEIRYFVLFCLATLNIIMQCHKT